MFIYFAGNKNNVASRPDVFMSMYFLYERPINGANENMVCLVPFFVMLHYRDVV